MQFRRFRGAAALIPVFILAACGSGGGSSAPIPSQPSSTKTGQMSPTAATGYKVIYNFAGGSTDGTVPYSTLLNVNGVLYGATSGGVTSGTIFKVNAKTGAEHVLYGNAEGPVDGSGLIDVNGTLYGTSFSGGTYGGGTIFSVSTSGSNFQILHSFSGEGNLAYSTDGATPYAGLTYVNGTLYGTTSAGGSAYPGCDGTLFSISTTGTNYRILHQFTNVPDGCRAFSALTLMNGVLYGTTWGGGSPVGGGTVYSINPDGTNYQVLYDFGGPTNDGSEPTGGLVALNGMLYGTTVSGGVNVGQLRFGTVFKISATGTESVVYSFENGGMAPSDGTQPNGQLTVVKGVLYGMTTGGGANGHGTLFSVTTKGAETILHSFGGFTVGDGSGPEWQGLVYVKAKGALFGTTPSGGTGSCSFGCGVIFEQPVP